MKTTLCLYGADVARITGKSVRYGNKILSTIRKSKGKPKNWCVTLGVLCEHLDVNYEEAERFFYNKTG